MKRTSTLLNAIAALIAILFPLSAFAQISLGNAQSYAVLGGSTVTNTGASQITGNVGVSPGSAITGFPPGVITGGVQHSNDAGPGGAQQAHTDANTAYTTAANQVTLPCNVNLTGQDLGLLAPLTPGVYCFNSSAQLTGNLTLDLLGNPNSFFVFQIGSTLTTAPGSTVTIINSGGSVCPPNIFWQVGSSATIDTTTSFVGNVLALASISLKTGASLRGRALALTGAVTLDTNNVGLCGPAIVCPVILVNPASLPNGNVGTAYSQTVSGSGGAAPYTFTLTSGSLPNGLLLNGGTGVIAGTPTTVGTFNFTITATDTNGCIGSRPYTIVMAAAGCPVITLSPATLPPGTTGSFYSAVISAAGGSGSSSFAISSGSLPNGLTINTATGNITGTPTVPGLFTFTVRATDAAACTGSRLYTILITAGLSGGSSGGATLDSVGLGILMVLLVGAALFVMNKMSI